ncbi:hypothetical protein ZHAWSFBX_CDS_0009 [Agrobacterium phage Alfirin]|nr:hypothetical protein ZHAWSFBX_CDS_0009 [Agrobacterium phage Alfirin]
MPPPWPIPALYPSSYPVLYLLSFPFPRHSSIPIPYPFHHPLIPPSFYPSYIHGPFLIPLALSSGPSLVLTYPAPCPTAKPISGFFYPYMKGLDYSRYRLLHGHVVHDTDAHKQTHDQQKGRQHHVTLDASQCTTLQQQGAHPTLMPIARPVSPPWLNTGLHHRLASPAFKRGQGGI